MLTRLLYTLLALPLLVAFGTSLGHARDLTFADRVPAQEAIERVYYSHQIGVTKPFEEAVLRGLLERKVRLYLKQSVALEQFWNTPITGEMLHRELERMVRQTRMPDRLRELFQALDNDPLLIQECLARPTSVNRLIHNSFAFDTRIHGQAQRRARKIHAELSNGELDPAWDHAARSVVALVRSQPGGVEGVARRLSDRNEDGVSVVELRPEAYERWRASAPQRPGDVGRVRDEREAYVVRVLLEEQDGRALMATYTFPKRAWDEWWRDVGPSLDERSVTAVTDGSSSIAQIPAAEGVPCDPGGLWDNGSLDDVVDPRWQHTAVWTGNFMILWGGYLYLSGGEINSGVRYDPAIDDWRWISNVEAPQERSSHVAVWTDSRMVVWGGVDGASHLDSGGLYDPVSDTWTASSIVGAPRPRRQHTAVWTGDRMVVWGGLDGGFYLDTGGRYDPVNDTWLPTSQQDGPGRRSYHTAVWTGDRMVVWGGFGGPGTGGSAFLDTGGRYDPVNDTWEPTTTVGAPGGRERHTAVWTNDEMIVWGGYDGEDVLPDAGGRYDPFTDTWAPTSTVDTPPARYNLSAVWTGIEMIVWGGRRLTGQWDGTGGRYYPGLDGDCDGVPNAQDCALLDPSAFAIPVEVTNLGPGSETDTLLWDSAAPGAGSGTVHDVAAELLGELPVGSGLAEECVASGVGEATAQHSAVPEPGSGYWYLVRGHNTCGEGTYGFTRSGDERTTATCP